MLQQTALYDWHVQHGAKMVDFAGWSMPIHYGSIVEEHVATRHAATLFDVSHMGRLRFHGDQALTFLDRIVTRRVADLKDGQIKYGLITNESGGILDDVLVYSIPDQQGRGRVSMVVNASNREKILYWLAEHQPVRFQVEVEDQTQETCMIAVQGPRALAIAQMHLDVDAQAIAYYRGVNCHFDDVPIVCSRTGYTGEDGCELIVPAVSAEAIWTALMSSGAPQAIRAAGLGARDTLRLEAAMPLYGHELNEQINPFQAGLDFAVNLKDRDFVGHAALVAAQSNRAQQRRIGLRLADKRVPREGYSILKGDATVGTITSGTYSPTLDCPIAMGYVQPEVAVRGSVVEVDIRGKRFPANVVELPFYKRSV